MAIRERALSKPESWQASLGLLPVYLRPAPIGADQDRYVLLNGAAGNFCLDLSRADISTKDRVDNAWSCNVGFYVSIQDEHIDLIRWDEPEKLERYTLQSVADNISGFHHYLERQTPDWNKSVVNFYGRAFRRLRSSFPPDAGREALQAFLYILACAMENETDLNTETLRSWALPEGARTAAKSVNAADFDSVLEHIAGIGAYRSLTPHIPLVFRHASGMIFQDAHRTAENSPQAYFPGMAPEAPLSTVPSSAIGVHFTPPTIARTLAEEAVLALDLSRPVLVALDPACGSGELLKELIRLLERRRFTGTLRLRAFDISPAAVDMARFSLAFEQKNAKIFAVEYEVLAADALAQPWPAADLVIMNPPFRRWNDIAPDQQAILTALLGVKASRHNLATGFLAKATDTLKPGGVVAAIAPRAFFESDAAREVRERVSATMAPRLIARLGSQVLFRDTLVDAGIYIGIKGGRHAPAIAVWADQISTSTSYALRALRRRHVQEVLPIAEDSHSIYADEKIGTNAEPWAPRRYTATALRERALRNPKLVPASRVFSIKQGARMGHDVFIVTKDYWRSLKESEGRFFRPAVLNQSIRDGELNDNLYAFFPYTDGLPHIGNEKELVELLPRYAREQLLPHKPALLARKSLADPGRWWEMIRRREWQQSPSPKLVSKYFGGVGSFAWDQPGQYVVGVGHAWLPKQTLENASAYGRLMAIYLNLPETEDVMDALSVRVAGGQLDLSSKYLNGLPVPDPKKMRSMELAKVATLENPLDEAARKRVRDLLELTTQ